MSSLLLKLPWFLAAPLVAGVAAVFALAGFMFTGDYFHETCKNERNLLTGDFEPSNCGEGAKVARALEDDKVVDGRGAATPAAPTRSPAATTAGAQATAATSITSVGTPTLTASVTAAGAASTTLPTGTPVPTHVATPAATGTIPPPTPTAPPPTSTPTPTAAPTQPPLQPGVLARGTFRDGAPGHTGKGRVEVQRLADGSLNILLADFSVTNGPDLYVVLSGGSDGSYGGSDLQLQKLKANNGTQNYAVPAGTDISEYGSILIWCRAFDVVFAYAPLGAP